MNDDLAERSLPPRAIIETVLNCNFKCTYSPYRILQTPKSTVKKKILSKIVEQRAEVDKNTAICLTLLGEALNLSVAVGQHEQGDVSHGTHDWRKKVWWNE